MVRAPIAVSRARIAAVVEEKAAWIERKTAEIRASLPPKRYYETGEWLMLLGRELPLVVRETPDRRKTVAEFIGGSLLVTIPRNRPADARARLVRRALEDWYRPRAQEKLNSTVTRWAAVTGLNPAGREIKALRSSWGFCTADNIVKINWRLVMAPQHLIDYVVLHELCHIREKNHSPRFWSLVADYMPDFRERKRILRRLGPRLEL